MIAIGHSATGAIIALAVIKYTNPDVPFITTAIIVFSCAVLSHYLMDTAPHGHYKISYKQIDRPALIKLSLDLVGGAVLLAILAVIKFGFFSTQFWLIMIGIGAAQLTDVFDGLVSLRIIPKYGLVRAHSRFHVRTHWHNSPSSPLENGARPLHWIDLWQFAVVGVAIFLLIQ